MDALLLDVGNVGLGCAETIDEDTLLDLMVMLFDLGWGGVFCGEFCLTFRLSGYC